ncbi:hypothetical protein MPSEU_000686700 [Mayamaea pseudoterrestris]|nr:hypothetical protein MPSEU_000686700 [Mayamaea pseudoterrestris]
MSTEKPTTTTTDLSQQRHDDKPLIKRLFTGFSFFNWINVLAFIVNITITYGFGTSGWANRPTNGELSAKYQTIITPNSKAFLIWTLIFLLQGVWAAWQLIVPSQRKHECIVSAVKYKYLLVTIWQVCWTLSFTWEIIWPSLIFMLLLCVTLIWTVLSLNAVHKCIKSWFIWQFPFSLHCGWILAATALNVNVTLVAYGASAISQMAIAGLCLVALLAVAVGFLSRNPVDLTPPCVIVWALGWIYKELNDPFDSISQSFTQKQINGFQIGAIVGVAIISALVLVKIMFVLLVHRPRRAATTSAATRTQESKDVINKHHHETQMHDENYEEQHQEQTTASDNV